MDWILNPTSPKIQMGKEGSGLGSGSKMFGSYSHRTFSNN